MRFQERAEFLACTADGNGGNKGILTSNGVARMLYGNYRDSIDHARCNDIPEAVLIPLNVKTKHSCEVVLNGKTPGGLDEPVHVTDAGPRVY
ncbi:hypothetical protein ACFYRJ_38550 [Streptomyces sp. NPDC005531]|uniref:hypothetical protein n=1 Tax=Streptomyces sp. NPDC005531 TaxID=3364722 RepID=UPI0036AFE75F